MKKLLISTTNDGKLKEIKEILEQNTAFKIISLKDINCFIDIIEDGKTFEENAMKKAKQTYEITQIPCLADDSGILIEEYEGWPGIETARFLGKEKSTNEYSRQRNEYILEKMKDLPKEKRKVKHITIIAYYDGKNEITTKGENSGYISTNPIGNNGFGFDEIFELEDGRTVAELRQVEKNKISSRKQALEKIKTILEKL